MNKRKYTPELISEFANNEVFVFGSNEGGFHEGGAARFALLKLNAVYGQKEGMQGKSYAIPTLDENFQPIAKEKQINYIENFINFASKTTDKTFYLTKIGCGIAAMPIEYMKECFQTAVKNCGFTIETLPQNIIFPIEFE